ncbi:MAG TPA: LptF/LptG family permease, partial [Opitutales bacterium]|nr:LptF/LptG family permease [Opitutales bacterium]
PLGILTGVLLVLGRLSAQQEITAMRSAGLSLLQIATPIFFIALVGVGFSVVVNFEYAPSARQQYRDDLAQAVRLNPLNFVVERTFVDQFPGYVLYVGEKEDEVLRDVWLWELDDQRRLRLFIQAESGGLAYDRQTESLLLTLDRGYSEIRDEDDPEEVRDSRNPPLEFARTSVRLPLENILGKRTGNVKLSRMTFSQIMEERQQILTAPEEELSRPRQSSLIRVQMEIQERFAMAFAVLSLATLAIPLGITIQRKETSANLFVALILAMTFYMLMVVFAWLERQPGLRPDLLMWVPNLLFQGIGIWLFIRTEKR